MTATLKTIIIGIIITVIGGLLLAYFSGLIFQTKEKTPEPTFNELKPQRLEINYSVVGGIFKILGDAQNNGVWASPVGSSKQLWWRKIDLSLTNSCQDPVNIDPAYFTLYLSRDNEVNNAAASFRPATKALNQQSNRLKSSYLNPDENIKGALYFLLPETIDGVDIHKFYNLLRYSKSGNCVSDYRMQ